MDHFNYQSGQLMAEDVICSTLPNSTAPRCSSIPRPPLVCHLQSIRFIGRLPPPGLLRMKANSNLAVLQCLAQAGAGFDIVSQGELERVILVKTQPKSCLVA